MLYQETADQIYIRKCCSIEKQIVAYLEHLNGDPKQAARQFSEKKFFHDWLQIYFPDLVKSYPTLRHYFSNRLSYMGHFDLARIQACDGPWFYEHNSQIYKFLSSEGHNHFHYGHSQFLTFVSNIDHLKSNSTVNPESTSTSSNDHQPKKTNLYSMRNESPESSDSSSDSSDDDFEFSDQEEILNSVPHTYPERSCSVLSGLTIFNRLETEIVIPPQDKPKRPFSC